MPRYWVCFSHVRLDRRYRKIPRTSEELYRVTNEDFVVYYPSYPESAYAASFTHLFDGYDAGYYSYTWSDVISAEIAEQFRSANQGFMDKKLGEKLRKEILETGFSRDADESIRAFLGREVNLDAFFKEMEIQ